MKLNILSIFKFTIVISMAFSISSSNEARGGDRPVMKLGDLACMAIPQRIKDAADAYCEKLAAENGNDDACALHVQGSLKPGGTGCTYSVLCGECDEVLEGTGDIPETQTADPK